MTPDKRVEEYKVFDCLEDGCGECEVCEYLSFREWAEGCAPAGSVIERSDIIEDYLKRKDIFLTQYHQDMMRDEKGLEAGWMSLKDDYSELCRALGFKGDSWFGDPLVPHAEIVAKAKALTQYHQDMMSEVLPFLKAYEQTLECDWSINPVQTTDLVYRSPESVLRDSADAIEHKREMLGKLKTIIKSLK